MKYSLNILHLFCDLLNMYGDRGNVLALSKRLEWRGHSVNIFSHHQGEEIDFSNKDIIILGGGGEKDDILALKMLLSKREELKEYVENGGVLLALCGGYQMLGDFYRTKNEELEALGLLDITHDVGERFIGNVIAETEMAGKKMKIAGFENHGARMKIKNYKPYYSRYSKNQRS